MSRRLAAAAALAGVLCLGAAASDPAERLPDPGQEAHARKLFQQFRCLVCQNESIDDSEAPLADDLRLIIRQQVAVGRTDTQIKDFMVRRYGEFVLLKPRFTVGNAALWLTPLVIVLAGGALFALRARSPTPLEAALTPEEEAQLKVLRQQERLDTVPPQISPRAHPGMTET